MSNGHVNCLKSCKKANIAGRYQPLNWLLCKKCSNPNFWMRCEKSTSTYMKRLTSREIPRLGHLLLPRYFERSSIKFITLFTRATHVCFFSGDCGSICCKRRSCPSSGCWTAQNRRGLGLQRYGRERAKLAHLHLKDHPRLDHQSVSSGLSLTFFGLCRRCRWSGWRT